LAVLLILPASRRGRGKEPKKVLRSGDRAWAGKGPPKKQLHPAGFIDGFILETTHRTQTIEGGRGEEIRFGKGESR